MGVLDKVKSLPPKLKKRIDEDIENAEFEDRRIGGSNDNPVLAEFIILNEAKHRSIVSIGRGRKFIINFTKNGNNVKVRYRFENHHRSRGWTLRTDLGFFDENGEIIKTDFWKAGLSEKDYRSYRRRTKDRVLNNIGEDVFAVLVICYRDPSLRVKKVVDEVVDQIKEEVIEELVEAIKNLFDGDDDEKDENEAEPSPENQNNRIAVPSVEPRSIIE